MTKAMAYYTDAELAAALHFIDAHDDSLDPSELQAWLSIKEMIERQAQAHRELNGEGE